MGGLLGEACKAPADGTAQRTNSADAMAIAVYDQVKVPPKRIPYFKPGKELKELLNSKS